MSSLTLAHTVAPVIGVKRESEVPLINPKRRVEVQDIVEIDNFPDVADGARVQSVVNTSREVFPLLFYCAGFFVWKKLTISF
jgi:hypothetical protein